MTRYNAALLGQLAQLVEQRIENPRVRGSIPRLATKIQTPTTLGWGFLLPVCANSRVFSRVPSESCGLRLRHR